MIRLYILLGNGGIENIKVLIISFPLKVSYLGGIMRTNPICYIIEYLLVLRGVIFTFFISFAYSNIFGILLLIIGIIRLAYLVMKEKKIID